MSRNGAEVLDVACGTGEPSLTLARRAPTVRILGVDRAEAMIPLASHKAARESLANAHFELMSSERLALPDASMDAVISRFGLMMFGDVPASARELAQVLRGGGSFSLAVWDDMAEPGRLAPVDGSPSSPRGRSEGALSARVANHRSAQWPRAQTAVRDAQAGGPLGHDGQRTRTLGGKNWHPQPHAA